MFYKSGFSASLFLTVVFMFLSFIQPDNAIAVDTMAIKEIKKISDSLNIAKEEYSIAVKDKKIVSNDEYNEAILFLEQTQKSLLNLSSMSSGFDQSAFEKAKNNINLIDTQIKAKEDPKLILEQVKLTDQSLENLAKVSLKEFPLKIPSLNNGRKIYEQNCATCHGVKGLGDGPSAATLNPKPVKFHDEEFIHSTSPYTFYRAIKNGIPGTAMPAWDYQLSLQEKWDVIRYIRSFVQKPNNNKELLDQVNMNNISNYKSLQDIAFTSDKSDIEIVELLKNNQKFANLKDEDLITVVNYIRDEKTIISQTNQSQELSKSEYLEQKINEIKGLLSDSKQSYQSDNNKDAIDKSIAAYLAFEPLERELGAKDTELARKLELNFNSLKGFYSTKNNNQKIESIIKEIETGLADTKNILTKENDGLALLFQSLFLILREGFEAIIIIMALIAFIKKSSNDRNLLKNLYYGIGLGVLASIVTAFILETILQKSNFSKEFLEGFTILLAAAMLFYVSHWLISKTQSDQWQKFIRTTLSSALSNKNQLAIVSVGFLSVYREGFETILFYKALYSTSSNANMISLGLVLGCIALAVISVLFYKFSVKIPIREFFFVTGLLLYYMVFSFVGKGLHEFQEGNILSITALNFIPEIDLIGLYPTMETVTAQIIILLAWIFAVIYSFKEKSEKITEKT